MWQVYALLAAVFAALTAIFSKLGVRDVDSGLATAIRVGFILLLTWGMSLYAGTWREVRQIGGHTWPRACCRGCATSRPCSWGTSPRSRRWTSSAYLWPCCWEYSSWANPVIPRPWPGPFCWCCEAAASASLFFDDIKEHP